MTENFSTGPVGALYTGGTLGCAGRPLAPMPGPAFRAACRRAGVLGEAGWGWTAAPLDSAEIAPADRLAIARRLLAREGPTIVLHGTDTLADTAATLAFLLTETDPQGRAVARHAPATILTGSQRPLLAPEGGIDPGSDAPGNLALAERAALDPGQAGLVSLVFGGRRISGARALKVSTLADAAFAAANGDGAPAPLPAADPARLSARLDRLAPHLGRRLVLPVLPAAGPAGLQAEAVGAAMDRLGARLGALHLLGHGLGTWPGAAVWTPLLARAEREGILVALGSSVPEGPVAPETYGAGAWLAAAGAVPTGDMTRPAAAAKLEIALALAAVEGWGLAETRAFLRRPLAGEIAAAP